MHVLALFRLHFIIAYLYSGLRAVYDGRTESLRICSKTWWEKKSMGCCIVVKGNTFLKCPVLFQCHMYICAALLLHILRRNLSMRTNNNDRNKGCYFANMLTYHEGPSRWDPNPSPKTWGCSSCSLRVWYRTRKVLPEPLCRTCMPIASLFIRSRQC